ncbi:MAG: hypothetical protein RLT05_24320 [Bauldia litoralis]
MFGRLDWSGTVGPTVRAATVRMEGRLDGPREVLSYDLDGTGLLACRDEDADGHSVTLHFMSANSRAAYERVLRSVGYLNRAAHFHEGERRFDVEVTDATGFPVRIGERSLWVEAPAAVTATTADTFDTLSPEVMRFDLDDHVGEFAVGFEEAAFALPANAPTAAETGPEAVARSAPAARAAEPAVRATQPADRFAAHYGDRGYWIHRQSEARVAAAGRGRDATARIPAPSIFRDSAKIYHIYRPAGATAAPEPSTPAATLVADPPAAFAGDDRVRVFRRRAPAPGAAAAVPSDAPAAADRDALHFADMFEGEVDPNGLERDPAREAERDFLFGLGRTRAA